MRITMSMLVLVVVGMFVGCGPSAEERYRTAQEIYESEVKELEEGRKGHEDLERIQEKFKDIMAIKYAHGGWNAQDRADIEKMVTDWAKEKKDWAAWHKSQTERIGRAKSRVLAAEKDLP